MNRIAEASLILGSAVLAALGVAIANLSSGGSVDAQVALTFVTFVVAWGGLWTTVRRLTPGANPYLLPLAAILSAVGITEVYRLNPSLGSLQRWWLIAAAALGSLTILWLRDGTAVLRRYRYLLLLGGVLLLMAPLLPGSWPLGGVTVNGSRLWLRLNLWGNTSLQFQPGEVGKLALVVFFASYLAERRQALMQVHRKVANLELPEPRQLMPLVVAWLASLIVMVYQRDLGASLLLFAVFMAMLYMATGQGVFPLAGVGLFAVGTIGAFQAFSHVQRRYNAWIAPFDDFEGAGYQIAQSLFAMGSGSIAGSGIGLGRPDLIPSAATDFIFAAIAEETGFVGAVGVLVGFALLVAAGFGIAVRSRDPFRKLLAAGITTVIGVQAVIIIGGVTRLLPLTGITLPFMSYGGSSLLSNTVALSILLVISQEEHR